MTNYYATTLSVILLVTGCAGLQPIDSTSEKQNIPEHAVTLPSGQSLFERPLYLIREMAPGPLKEKLESCELKLLERTDFSIGHRGAPLYFPEHTLESYQAAVAMGAGIVECDVTFTLDKELVCRHAQCDLHATTNILETALAAKCTVPFQPAVYDRHGQLISPASAQCCTSDITLTEFKSLQGKIDAFNPNATTVAEYMQNTTDEEQDLYITRGTVLSHKESIALFQRLNVRMAPELKSPNVPMPFDGFSQQDFAQKMINEYKQADVLATQVWPQSFNLKDMLYWIQNEPDFGRQAIYLDGRYNNPAFDHRNPETWSPSMEQLVADGVRIIAPPFWMLLEIENGQIVPSPYAQAAQNAGLNIITWTLERSRSLADGGGWYYQTLNGDNPNPSTPNSIINNDSDILVVLNALAKDVGILGIFSDWPATVTYYANCMNLKQINSIIK